MIMGGKILEFKGENIYNEGKAEGQINAIAAMLIKGISREKLCEVFGREEVEKAEKHILLVQNPDE